MRPNVAIIELLNDIKTKDIIEDLVLKELKIFFTRYFFKNEHLYFELLFELFKRKYTNSILLIFSEESNWHIVFMNKVFLIKLFSLDKETLLFSLNLFKESSSNKFFLINPSFFSLIDSASSYSNKEVYIDFYINNNSYYLLDNTDPALIDFFSFIFWEGSDYLYKAFDFCISTGIDINDLLSELDWLEINNPPDITISFLNQPLIASNCFKNNHTHLSRFIDFDSCIKLNPDLFI